MIKIPAKTPNVKQTTKRSAAPPFARHNRQLSTSFLILQELIEMALQQAKMNECKSPGYTCSDEECGTGLVSVFREEVDGEYRILITNGRGFTYICLRTHAQEDRLADTQSDRHIQTNTHMQIDTRTQTDTQTHTHIYIYTYICMYVCTYLFTYDNTYRHITQKVDSSFILVHYIGRYETGKR